MFDILAMILTVVIFVEIVILGRMVIHGYFDKLYCKEVAELRDRWSRVGGKSDEELWPPPHAGYIAGTHNTITGKKTKSSIGDNNV